MGHYLRQDEIDLVENTSMSDLLAARRPTDKHTHGCIPGKCCKCPGVYSVCIALLTLAKRHRDGM